MMSIGAPQCRHTNVGALEPLVLWLAESSGAAGGGTCSSARATLDVLLALRVGKQPVVTDAMEADWAVRAARSGA